MPNQEITVYEHRFVRGEFTLVKTLENGNSVFDSVPKCQFGIQSVHLLSDMYPVRTINK